MLSWMYSSLQSFRNLSYDKSWLSSHSLERPVISIGNITMGGTGKTPIVDHLLKYTSSKGILSGVISRGYKGSYSGVQRVKSGSDPIIFGDEPAMLALRNPNIPVFVCSDRVKAGKELISSEPKTKLIFADDAFQHRRLFRDLNILIVDLLESEKNYQVLPKGRAREPLESFARADFVILNKANLANSEAADKMKDFLRPYCKDNCEYIIGNYLAKSLVEMNNINLESESNKNNYLLVSAIGNPLSFKNTALQLGFNVIDQIKFKDHYNYSLKDLKLIYEKAKDLNVTKIICTEKDAIKISPLIKGDKQDFSWSFLELEVELLKAELLYESIINLAS